MTEAIVKVLAEVLYVLAVATREIKENLASKSIGRSIATDLRLDQLPSSRLTLLQKHL